MKFDKSFFGHILEGQLQALLGFGALILWTDMSFLDCYMYAGIIPLVFFLGREKRDWEVATKAPAGDFRGYFGMFARWNNFHDWVGNAIVYAGIMAAGHFL